MRKKKNEGTNQNKGKWDRPIRKKENEIDQLEKENEMDQ